MIPETKQLQTKIETKQDKMVEGSWTPVLSTLANKAPTMTYIIQEGTYKKIGKLVYLSFYIRGKITALKDTDNYATVTGIPFAAKDSMFKNLLNISALYQMLENETNVNVLIDTNTIRVQWNYGESAAKLKITPTGGTGYFEIAATGWYETNE